MDIDNDYMSMSAQFDENCTTLKLDLRSYFFIPPDGKSDLMEGEAALKFLKQTSHGRQSELSNFAVLMFSPDVVLADLDYQLTVKIPDVKDVLYKANKYDKRKKRKVNGESMTIPTIKRIAIGNAAVAITIDKYKKLVASDAKYKVYEDGDLLPGDRDPLPADKWDMLKAILCRERRDRNV